MPPPRDPTSASGRAYAQAQEKSNLSLLEEQLQEAATKRTNMSTTTFLRGRQSSPADVATTIANLITDIGFRFNLPHDVTQGPSIVCMLTEYATIITGQDFDAWYGTQCLQHPWIVHLLITQVHTLMFTLATI